MTPAIVEGVRSDAYDVGFCSMSEGETDLCFTPILSQEYTTIVNKKHPLAALAGQPMKLEDLEPYEILTYPENIHISSSRINTASLHPGSILHNQRIVTITATHRKAPITKGSCLYGRLLFQFRQYTQIFIGISQTRIPTFSTYNGG